jgi:hypothetical protein
MLGMVFTELLEMVESAYSFDVADAVIARAGVSATYTSVGDYSDAELMAIVNALSLEVGEPVSKLMRIYGRHLFHQFKVRFPSFFESHTNAFSFFTVLESHVHTEVRKLYPRSRPPLIGLTRHDDGSATLEYRSDRGLVDFAHGLIEACLEHYAHPIEGLRVEDASSGAGTFVLFHLPRPA